MKHVVGFMLYGANRGLLTSAAYDLRTLKSPPMNILWMLVPLL